MAAHDKYGDDINVAGHLHHQEGDKEKSERRIAAYFGKFVFHKDG